MRCSVPGGQRLCETIEGSPELPSMGIRFHQQFMSGTDDIDEATIRGLAAESILRRAANNAISGGPRDEQGNCQAAGKTWRRNPIDRIKSRIQPPEGNPTERQSWMVCKFGHPALKTFRIAGERIVCKNAVLVGVRGPARDEPATKPQAHRRLDVRAEPATR